MVESALFTVPGEMVDNTSITLLVFNEFPDTCVRSNCYAVEFSENSLEKWKLTP